MLFHFSSLNRYIRSDLFKNFLKVLQNNIEETYFLKSVFKQCPYQLEMLNLNPTPKENNIDFKELKCLNVFFY